MAQVNPFVLRYTVNIVQLLQDAVRRILSYRYDLIGASLEQVQLAAVKAYLHKQIVRLPEQYRTDVQQLSGG